MVNELQTVIEFNEEMLEGTNAEIASALRGDRNDREGSVTDRLLESQTETVCWTCGNAVDRSQIERTLDELRSLRQEKTDARSEMNEEIDSLEAELDAITEKRRRHEELTEKRSQIESELEERSATIEDLEAEREALTEKSERLEEEVEELQETEHDELLDLHKEANRIEVAIENKQAELTDLADEIQSVENRINDEDGLSARREAISEELADLRTRIERIEEDAVERFNEHMAEILDILEYENVERIWLERRETEVLEGRRKVVKGTFDLHVVRRSESGTAYEDTIDHLSESERDVMGLAFALAGYLVHDVYETLPFMLLDSLEAIDADRIASLVEYFSEYAEYLVAALLPEDAAALSDEHQRLSQI